MNSFKQLLALAIIVVLSQPIFADTCYDPAANSVKQSFPSRLIEPSYIYKNLQGWETKDGVIHEFHADKMTFKQASYSFTAGLHCTYSLYNSGIFPDSFPVESDRDLIKQEQYLESDFANHVGWHKDSTTGIYKCINDHVAACAFK